MTLDELMGACIESKQGNKEFALFFVAEDQSWIAIIGNSDRYFLIGATEPKFRASGFTAIEAVQNLLRLLEKAHAAAG